MANEHDIHTCGCDSCEAAYARRYYSSDKEYEKAKKDDKNRILNNFSVTELKSEIKKRGKKNGK